MLTVAMASENDALDAEVYRHLLARLLDTEVQRWNTDITFQGGGFRHVHNLTPTFLEIAEKNGITRHRQRWGQPALPRARGHPCRGPARGG